MEELYRLWRRPWENSLIVINTGSRVSSRHQSQNSSPAARGHSGTCVWNTARCHMVQRCFTPPKRVLSSLVSSYQQPPEVGSAPEGSTVQLWPSGEEDPVRGRGSFRRCEDKTPRYSAVVCTSRPGEVISSKCTLQQRYTSLFFFLDFSHLWATRYGSSVHIRATMPWLHYCLKLGVDKPSLFFTVNDTFLLRAVKAGTERRCLTKESGGMAPWSCD